MFIARQDQHFQESIPFQLRVRIDTSQKRNRHFSDRGVGDEKEGGGGGGGGDGNEHEFIWGQHRCAFVSLME